MEYFIPFLSEGYPEKILDFGWLLWQLSNCAFSAFRSTIILDARWGSYDEYLLLIFFSHVEMGVGLWR